MIIGRPYLPDGRRLIVYKAEVAEYEPFAEYHYMPGHGPISRCYIAELDTEPVAWLSTMRAAGNDGWRIHRLVVLPEHERQGVGYTLAAWAAQHHPPPVSIRTKHRSFVEMLLRNGWRESKHPHRTTPDERTGFGDTLAWTAVYVPKALQESRCQHCRNRFVGKRADSKFCSGRCRVAAHRA